MGAVNSRQIELVRTSFGKVEPIAEKVAELFYGRLFDTNPRLRGLFRGDMREQGRKLMAMIATAVGGLKDVDRLVPVLRKLGERHVDYGVTDRDYHTVEAALLWALEQCLGPDLDGETREAWTAVYDLLAVTMQDAAAALKQRRRDGVTGDRDVDTWVREVSELSAHLERALRGERVGRIGERFETAQCRRLAEQVTGLLDRLQGAGGDKGSDGRMRRALDVVATNVMMADAQHNIVYLNHSLKEMLLQAEADIRKQLPQFSAGAVLGASIDLFHKNPIHQRNMLAGLKSTHKTRLQIGGRSFDLIVNPIVDDAGERLGTVVEWKDVTQEAAENLRIKYALDNVNSNVMIADPDGQIVYMNRSVTGMLAQAEPDLRKVLPQFDVRRVVGSNFDGFHKNPAHQRGLLANLRSTYRTQIEVGPRTFSLIANPILDETGGRVGTVVEWKDRTEEVRVEAEIGDIVQAAVDGDFTRRIELAGKEGFLKRLADGINQFINTSAVGLQDVARVLEALAKGDLTETITNEYGGTLGKLRHDSNSTVEQLTGIVTQIKDATEAINTAAKEIAHGNADLSQRTEEQAASLEETASSMEQLTSTVKQNAQNAKQANQLAIGASDVAVKGGQVVAHVVTTMSSITESSKKIVDIISVIDGIAFQTNILALNAAVEAARAGEQGRGFAVVATEVRNLAQRSAAAAKEIKTLISDSVEKVQNGSVLVEQAGKTMDEIVTAVKRVTDIMGEITAASQEQSSGIEQVNQAVTQMDEVTQQNAALVEQAAAAAESLEDQAQNLAQAVAIFKLAEAAEELVERRSPTRATNVERLSKKAAVKPALRRPAPASAETGKHKPAPGLRRAAAGGGDDEWEEF